MHRLLIGFVLLISLSGCMTAQNSRPDYQQRLASLQALKASLADERQADSLDLKAVRGEYACTRQPSHRSLIRGKTVSLEIEEGELREVLAEVSAQTEVTVVMDDYVEGLITVQLDDIDLAHALDTVLAIGDFDYRLYPNHIFIGVREANSPSFSRLASTCTYRPVFVSPEEIAMMLPPLYRQYVQPNSSKGTLTIVAPKSIQTRLKQDIYLFDRAPEQVVLELSVIEVSQEALDIIGIDWNFAKNFAAAANKQYLLDASFFNSSVQLPAYQVGHFLDAISLLSQNGDAHIKTMPSIVTQDGRQAQFNSMQTIFGLKQLQNQNGKQRELAYGIQMAITPHVSSNDLIQMEINNASVSDLVYDQEYPRLVGHSISSSVYVANGSALVIGGLLQKKNQRKVKGVSGTGELSFMESLFQQRNERSYETEVLIMIRPSILNS